MSDKDINKNDYQPDDDLGEEFSLESILAEFKGDAFIAGDKKTPEQILNAAAERIVREANGEVFDNAPEAAKKSEGAMKQLRNDDDFFADIREPIDKDPDDGTAKPEPMSPLPEPKVSDKENNDFFAFFNDNDAQKQPVAYASKGAEESYRDEISRIVEEEADKEEKLRRAEAKAERRSSLKDRRSKHEQRGKVLKMFDDEPDEEVYEGPDDEFREEPEEEPPLSELALKAGRGIKSMSVRSVIAFVLCVFMVIFTYLFEAGKPVPFGIGSNAGFVSGILLLMQLVVMLLSLDVLISGAASLFDGIFGGETLVLLSNVFTVVQALSAIAGKKEVTVLPFCTVSAVALMFALRGKRAYALAERDTLRSAVSTANPLSVIADDEAVADRIIIKKTSVSTDGFYRNFKQADISETAYRKFAPIVFAVCVVLAVLVSLISKKNVGFLYILAALTAVSASFSVMLSFALPYKRAARKARRSGAAIAGWGGTCCVAEADSVTVTDEDIFPPGTLTINSVKIFEGVSQQKAIAYTSSMIIASGSGSAKVFSELLKSQSLPLDTVSDFACYQGGGISGLIRGERVMVGSAAFMNLMGVRIPDSVNAKDAMFTVINDTLAAVFLLNYIPANSVQKALVAMMRTKITMLFAVRDFNITPAMVQKKFKVDISNFEHLPVEECYSASDEKPREYQDSAAILSRGGLAPLADVVVMGSQLKLISTLTTAVSIITSIIGVVFIAFMCLSSGTVLCGSVLTYMLLVQAVVLIISSLARRK